MRSFPALMFMALMDFLIYTLLLQPMLTRLTWYYVELGACFDVNLYTR